MRRSVAPRRLRRGHLTSAQRFVAPPVPALDAGRIQVASRNNPGHHQTHPELRRRSRPVPARPPSAPSPAQRSCSPGPSATYDRSRSWPPPRSGYWPPAAVWSAPCSAPPPSASSPPCRPTRHLTARAGRRGWRAPPAARPGQRPGCGANPFRAAGLVRAVASAEGLEETSGRCRSHQARPGSSRSSAPGGSRTPCAGRPGATRPRQPARR